MSKTLKIVLAANLIVLAILSFVYPHLMVGPGKLIPGHSKLETDCFACHAPFVGSTTERCTTCHKTEQIGKLTTLGQPIQKPAVIPGPRSGTRNPVPWLKRRWIPAFAGMTAMGTLPPLHTNTIPRHLPFSPFFAVHRRAVGADFCLIQVWRAGGD